MRRAEGGNEIGAWSYLQNPGLHFAFGANVKQPALAGGALQWIVAAGKRGVLGA